ncbi:MAG: helix-turn-helix transcriptional regulator [Planctomycetota bacterium]
MSKPLSEPQTAASEHSLGAYLSVVRGSLGLTLRDVEKATEKRVSNAYLSQVENDKIARPSPNVLHALAGVYKISYEVLMDKAGYLSATSSDGSGALRSSSKSSKTPKPNALSHQELSEAEEQQLLEYLAFMRSRQSRSSEK